MVTSVKIPCSYSKWFVLRCINSCLARQQESRQTQFCSWAILGKVRILWWFPLSAEVWREFSKLANSIHISHQGRERVIPKAYLFPNSRYHHLQLGSVAARISGRKQALSKYIFTLFTFCCLLWESPEEWLNERWMTEMHWMKDEWLKCKKKGRVIRRPRPHLLIALYQRAGSWWHLSSQLAFD